MKSIIIIVLIFACFLMCHAEDSAKNCETIKDCEEDPNYPEEKLNRLDFSKYKFTVSHIEGGKSKRSTDVNKGSFLVETKLCDSKVSFMRPQRLQNVKEEWRTIVNHKNLTQFVRREECLSENFPCTYNLYPNTVRSHCQQNYVTVSLWAFDIEQNCLVMDKFSVPSSCDCIIAH
jgi:hypothetical protein